MSVSGERGVVKRTRILAIVSFTLTDEIDDTNEDLLGKRREAVDRGFRLVKGRRGAPVDALLLLRRPWHAGELRGARNEEGREARVGKLSLSRSRHLSR
jgi:hypothetical protein